MHFGCREQAEQEAKMEEAIAKATEEIIEKFEEQWKPAIENLQEAESVFDDLDGESAPIMTACKLTLEFPVCTLHQGPNLRRQPVHKCVLPSHLKLPDGSGIAACVLGSSHGPIF